MANTVVGVEIKVKGDQANQSVGSFKKQLKEAQAELVALTAKFGVTSKEAGEAAKRVADLKDAFADAKDLSDAFNPGNKFQALSNAIRGATSGFTALQGAQALFGSESEEVQKTLAKVQGALAFSEGISGVLDLAGNFKNLAAVVKGGLTTAFGTLRNAIISTGIGALAVGIGLLIANFDKVKQAIINLIPGAQGFFNILGDIVDTVTGWFGASEDVLDTQKALKEATDQLNDSLADYEGQIDRVVKIEKLRAQIAGQSQAQIDKLEQAGILAKINNYNKLIEEARKFNIDTTALEQKRLEAQEQLLILGLQAEVKAADQRRALQAKQSEDQKKRTQDNAQRKEKEKKDNEEFLRQALEAANKLDEIRLENTKESIKEEFDRKQFALAVQQQAEIDNLLELKNKKLINDTQYEEAKALIINTFAQRQSQLLLEKTKADADAAKTILETTFVNPFEKIQTDFESQRNALADKENAAIDAAEKLREQKIQAAKDDAAQIIKIEQDFQDTMTGIQKGASDARSAINEAERNIKLQGIKTVIDDTKTAIDAVAEGTVVAKALGIASALISTFQGANEIIKTPSPPGIPAPLAFALKAAAVAKTIALGLKQVRSISAVKVPGKGGGGGGAGNVQAPSVQPLTPAAQTTTLDQSSINQIGAASSRAFVLERDVTNNQERVARLNRAARIN
jgi:hypothetical protein